MRFLFRFGLIALVGAWVVAEFALVSLAEGRIEQQVSANVQESADVGADVGSFPVVTKLLFTGEVSDFGVTLDDVARAGLTYSRVDFRFNGVQVDRTAMFGGDMRITSVQSGTITARIDAGALGSLLGQAGDLAGVDVRIDGRTLNLGGATVALASDLLPCQPSAEVDGEQVVVSCAIAEIPAILIDAIQARG